MVVTRQQYRKMLLRGESRYRIKESMFVINKLKSLKKQHIITNCRKHASSTSLRLSSIDPLPDLTALQCSNSENIKTYEEGVNTMNTNINKRTRKISACANLPRDTKKRRPLISLRNINKSAVPLCKTHKCTCINSTKLKKNQVKPQPHGNLKQIRKKKAWTVSKIARVERNSNASLCTHSSGDRRQVTYTTECSITNGTNKSACVQIHESGRNQRAKRRRLLYHANNRLLQKAKSTATIITISSDNDDQKPEVDFVQNNLSPDTTLSQELELLQSVLDTLDKEQSPNVAPWPADLENISVTPLQFPSQDNSMTSLAPVPSTSQGGPPWCANCSSRFWHDMVTMAKFYSIGPYSNLFTTKSVESERKN